MVLCFGSSYYVYKLAVVFTTGKFNYTIYYCKNGMVFTNHYAFTRVVVGTTLTNDDITRGSRVATIYFRSEERRVWKECRL